MAAEKGPMSGFRDMLSEQMIARQSMLGTIQAVYEDYGFTPLKTPALELQSTLQGKYGEEGDKLMYQFEDNGGRKVALRYDQTVPLARVVAQHAGNIPMPYKRYAVGEVWRGERPQAGRYREFTQFDADTVGTKSPIADAEIVAMMSDTMEALGANAVIGVNNRRILDGLAEKAGASDERESIRIITTIDKVGKVGLSGVTDILRTDFGDNTANIVAEYLTISGTPLERLGTISRTIPNSVAIEEGVDNLMSVFRMLESSGYDPQRVSFDQSIARGLDYYTGIVYETTLTDIPELGSVCSGGRFDNLVKAMGGPDLPAVGTSVGVDRLYDGLQELGKLEGAKTPTKVLVSNFNQDSSPDYMRIATELRKAGVASEVYYDSSKLGKQLGFANKLGIPFVVILGPKEISEGTVTIKILSSGEQIVVPQEDLSETINEINGKI